MSAASSQRPASFPSASATPIKTQATDSALLNYSLACESVAAFRGQARKEGPAEAKTKRKKKKNILAMGLHKDSGKVGMIVILAQAFGREQCSQWK